jgi:hypothetical protein
VVWHPEGYYRYLEVSASTSRLWWMTTIV